MLPGLHPDTWAAASILKASVSQLPRLGTLLELWELWELPKLVWLCGCTDSGPTFCFRDWTGLSDLSSPASPPLTPRTLGFQKLRPQRLSPWEGPGPSLDQVGTQSPHLTGPCGRWRVLSS